MEMQAPTRDVVLNEPYVLDSLGLSDCYLQRDLAAVLAACGAGGERQIESP
jgi:predicted nuclease of restriction endonuclease-like (RecB) superfamily